MPWSYQGAVKVANIILAMKVLLVIVALLLPVGATSTLEFPSPKGAVNDFAQILDDRQEEELEAFLEDFWRRYQVAIVVVTLPEVGLEPLEGAATRLFDTWNIGRTGVLLLIAWREEQAWVQVGHGLKGTLGEGKVQRILGRYVIPRVREGDAGTGAILGVLALAREIAEAKEKDEVATEASSRAFAPLVILLIMVVVLILVLPAALRLREPPGPPSPQPKDRRRPIP